MPDELELEITVFITNLIPTKNVKHIDNLKARIFPAKLNIRFRVSIGE